MAVAAKGALRATIYGARGSLPNPSVSTQIYGGATTCLGLETPEQIPIVFDAGSGIFDLGLELEKRETEHQLHMFFTHTHWDHVQGLPFFSPFYDPSWEVHIYSFGERRATVREIFSGVYAQRFFPVPFEQLDAKITFHELSFTDTVQVGSTTVTCCRMNHPGFALGFRVNYEDRCLFFASDAAPFAQMLFGDRFHVRQREQNPDVLREMTRLQAQMEEAILGAELLFHDANYTDEEYEKFFHFGHASIRQACSLARRCEVKRLVLWHHDRGRTDEELEKITASQIAQAKCDRVIVDPAMQGTTYVLPVGSSEILSIPPF